MKVFAHGFDDGTESEREGFWRPRYGEFPVARLVQATGDGMVSILLLFGWWMILVEAEQAAGAAVVVMG